MVNVCATNTIPAWVEALRAEAARLGFVACGIAGAAPDALRAARLERWLGEGHHGTMDWMAAPAWS